MVTTRAPSVKFDLQGDVLAVGVPGGRQAFSMVPDEKNRGGGIRGVISGFSAASRRRLLRTAARLDVPQDVRACLLTLTYPEQLDVCPHCAKADLRSLVRRLQRYWSKRGYDRFACIWRMEAQRRGAVHFHLICYMPFVKWQVVAGMWADIIAGGSESEFFELAFARSTDIEQVRDRKRVKGYVSKELAYVAKAEAREAHRVGDGVCRRCRLGYAAYWDAPGRSWGIEGRKYLPWCPQFLGEAGLGRWFWRFRRAARRYWGGVGYRNNFGFCLFTPSGGEWIALAVYLQGLDLEDGIDRGRIVPVN